MRRTFFFWLYLFLFDWIRNFPSSVVVLACFCCSCFLLGYEHGVDPKGVPRGGGGISAAGEKGVAEAAAGYYCLLRAISADTLCVASLGGYRAVVGRRMVGGVVDVAERLSAEHNMASEKLRTELVALHPDDGQSVVYTRGAWRVNGIIQDVAASKMPFSKKGPCSVCVLFANSNVALNQPGSFGSNFTYEGCFVILQLSASFTVAEEDGRRRSGGFCFSLAGPNGRVIGGVVVRMLRAASPIQPKAPLASQIDKDKILKMATIACWDLAPDVEYDQVSRLFQESDESVGHFLSVARDIVQVSILLRTGCSEGTLPCYPTLSDGPFTLIANLYGLISTYMTLAGNGVQIGHPARHSKDLCRREPN